MAITAQRRGMVMYASVHALALFVSICSFVLLAPSPVPAATSTTYDYDANGNMIRGDGKYYEYNDANQLARVRKGDASGQILAEYFYDSSGQRVKKIEAGVTTYYIGKHYETEMEDANPANSESYFFAEGLRVAKRSKVGALESFSSDHLGSTNVVTDSTGDLVERSSYYPFGELRLSGPEHYKFTGKEVDGSTGAYYFEARYYEPGLMHFAQADTAQLGLYDPQELNRYSYVLNRPLRLVDPSGHFFSEIVEWTSDKVSRGVDKAVNYASNTSAGKWLGEKTLALIEDSSMANADSATKAAYYGALAEGLGHSYEVSKKAFGEALSGPIKGSTVFDLSLILAEEMGADPRLLDLARTGKDIYGLTKMAKGIGSLGKSFHFSRQQYKFLVGRLGKENYSKLVKLINDNKLHDAMKIIKDLDRAGGTLKKNIERYNQ